MIEGFRDPRFFLLPRIDQIGLFRHFLIPDQVLLTHFHATQLASFLPIGKNGLVCCLSMSLQGRQFGPGLCQLRPQPLVGGIIIGGFLKETGLFRGSDGLTSLCNLLFNFLN